MPYIGQKPADIIATAVDTTTGTFSGDIDASTVNATGDTAAGDNAAIGFTSAEGLILTGQGSTNDVTIKNDADADVIEIPTGTVNVTMAGTLGVAGVVTANAGVVVDEMTLDGDTLTATDDFILDVAGDITLDAGGNQIRFFDSGTEIGLFGNENSDFAMVSSVQDKNIIFQGNDGGAGITALTLDMSAGGAATIANGLTLTDGNLVVANGHGIDFSATGGGTNGTGASELLDDYEEGTWTPTWAAASGSAGGLGAQVGRYVKIGNMVQASCYLALSNKGSLSGSMQITGLPYTSVNVNSNFTAASIWINTTTNGNKFDGDFHLQSYVSPGNTAINVQSINGDGGANAIDAADVTNTTDIMINISYRAQ